eukprot:TRINITY_DN15457_c0_g3_i2.p1 TRINITY_DN15457_c0_g3~~TRINITY_DN15457_c0_g3_i2.p1  ORF type:complete len:642 (+),score=102.76 TRINITY_DN15457_c0_g3_i2:112-2037(+)
MSYDYSRDPYEAHRHSGSAGYAQDTAHSQSGYAPQYDPYRAQTQSPAPASTGYYAQAASHGAPPPAEYSSQAPQSGYVASHDPYYDSRSYENRSSHRGYDDRRDRSRDRDRRRDRDRSRRRRSRSRRTPPRYEDRGRGYEAARPQQQQSQHAPPPQQQPQPQQQHASSSYYTQPAAPPAAAPAAPPVHHQYPQAAAAPTAPAHHYDQYQQPQAAAPHAYYDQGAHSQRAAHQPPPPPPQQQSQHQHYQGHHQHPPPAHPSAQAQHQQHQQYQQHPPPAHPPQHAAQAPHQQHPHQQQYQHHPPPAHPPQHAHPPAHPHAPPAHPPAHAAHYAPPHPYHSQPHYSHGYQHHSGGQPHKSAPSAPPKPKDKNSDSESEWEEGTQSKNKSQNAKKQSKQEKKKAKPPAEKTLKASPLVSCANLPGPMAVSQAFASWKPVIHDDHRRSFVSQRKKAFTVETLQNWWKVLKGKISWSRPSNAESGFTLPRSCCWLTRGNCKDEFEYAGITFKPHKMEQWFLEITDKVCRTCGLKERPNNCTANLYNDGKQYFNWHTDEKSLGDGKNRDTLVVSLSLGATRSFEIRPKDDPFEETKLDLEDGDLLVMEGLTQKHYKHRIVADDTVKGARINLTWRWTVNHSTGPPQR